MSGRKDLVINYLVANNRKVPSADKVLEYAQRLDFEIAVAEVFHFFFSMTLYLLAAGCIGYIMHKPIFPTMLSLMLLRFIINGSETVRELGFQTTVNTSKRVLDEIVKDCPVDDVFKKQTNTIDEKA